MAAPHPSASARFRAAYPRALAVGAGISVAAHAGLAVVASGVGVRLPEPSGALAAPQVITLAPAPPDAPPAVRITPPATPVQAGKCTNFRVRFHVAQQGIYYGQVTIHNNDPDEDPYNILLAATATIDVK